MGVVGVVGVVEVVAHGPGPEMRFATKFRCDCFLLASFLYPPKFSPPRIWVSFIDFFILLFCCCCAIAIAFCLSSLLLLLLLF